MGAQIIGRYIYCLMKLEARTTTKLGDTERYASERLPYQHFVRKNECSIVVLNDSKILAFIFHSDHSNSKYIFIQRSIQFPSEKPKLTQ